MAYPHTIFGWFLELLFPYRCLSCRRYLDREYICRPCFNRLPIKGQGECVGCSRPSPDGMTCILCKDGYQLDQLMVVSDFNDPAVAMLIRRMKYGFIRDLVEPLHRLSRKYLLYRAKKGRSFIQDNPLLVPVPLHIVREQWRGFNQAALLGESIAGTYQLELVHALECTRHKTHQAEILERNRRIENVRGLYQCIDPNLIRGRKVMLIDDVCTTGATLNECAAVLKASGACSVSALVIARG